jgi:hypothetical protein
MGSEQAYFLVELPSVSDAATYADGGGVVGPAGVKRLVSRLDDEQRKAKGMMSFGRIACASLLVRLAANK